MKTETKIIGGFKYTMTQVGMETGEQIALKLGLSVAAFFSGVAAQGLTKATLARSAMSGLAPAIAALTPENLRFCREKFAENTIVWLPDGNKLRDWPLTEQYDDHFRGRYVEAALWFKWGVQMNHFFGNALELVDQILAEANAAKKAEETATASDSASPPASVGGSGVSSSTSPEARA